MTRRRARTVDSRKARSYRHSDIWILTRVHGAATRSPVPASCRTLIAERGRSAGDSRTYSRRYGRLRSPRCRPAVTRRTGRYVPQSGSCSVRRAGLSAVPGSGKVQRLRLTEVCPYEACVLSTRLKENVGVLASFLVLRDGMGLKILPSGPGVTRWPAWPPTAPVLPVGSCHQGCGPGLSWVFWRCERETWRGHRR